MGWLFGLLAAFLVSACSSSSSSLGDGASDATPTSCLALASSLESTTSPTTRVFKDTSGATTPITISGTCDASGGDVTLSGLGLTASSTATCSNGTFSTIVYYSSGTPAFTSDFGAKKITVSQSGQTSVSTTLFKAATTHTTVTLISTAAQLAAMALTADVYYILENDIDLASQVSATNNWTALAPSSGATNFQGVFEGNGHTISNLNVSSGRGFIDLLGGSSSSPAVISNVQLSSASVTCGTSACGLLVGTAGQYSTVTGVTVSGTISGTTSIGGIVGFEYGTLTMSSANATVSGTTAAAVIAGNTGTTATLSQVKAAGSVSVSTGSAGGLVGGANGTISDSYSTAQITGASGNLRIGGLIGKMASGTVARCIAYGDVIATGTTSSGPGIGQDLSSQAATAILYNSSAACTGCTGTGFTAETPTQLQTKSTFSGFDFTTPVWTITDGVSYPKLYWETL